MQSWYLHILLSDENVSNRGYFICADYIKTDALQWLLYDIV